MRVFLTGATGYIGGSIARRLVAEGHRVAGLVRSAEKAGALAAAGIVPLPGDLGQLDVIARAAREADAVINAAEANERPAVDAMLDALAGSRRCFIQTSGSGIVGDEAAGGASDRIFDEETPVQPVARMAQRFAIDERVLAAAGNGVRSVVIRPSLIYGPGHGLHRDSYQVPALIDQARASGIARHIGPGENIWSHVTLDDTVDLYVRALERAPAGSLFYAENGEADMRTVVAAISRMLGQGGATAAWPVEDAVAHWGPRVIISLASNSRVRGRRSRETLGWVPRGPSLLEEIEHGYYARHYGRA